MTARTFAALCGTLYLALGILGFVPAVWERPPSGPALAVRVFHASVLGVFAVNILLSMTHLVIGLWAVLAANNRYSALNFARAGAVVLAVLGVAGLLPAAALKTAYGTLPLYGSNAWLHLGTALIAVYFAFRPGYRLTYIGMQQMINPHRTSP